MLFLLFSAQSPLTVDTPNAAVEMKSAEDTHAFQERKHWIDLQLLYRRWVNIRPGSTGLAAVVTGERDKCEPIRNFSLEESSGTFFSHFRPGTAKPAARCQNKRGSS